MTPDTPLYWSEHRDIPIETAHWEVLTFVYSPNGEAEDHPYTDRQVNSGTPTVHTHPKEPAQKKNVPWDGAFGRRPLDKVDEGQSYRSSHTSNTRILLRTVIAKRRHKVEYVINRRLGNPKKSGKA